MRCLFAANLCIDATPHRLKYRSPTVQGCYILHRMEEMLKFMPKTKQFFIFVIPYLVLGVALWVLTFTVLLNYFVNDNIAVQAPIPHAVLSIAFFRWLMVRSHTFAATCVGVLGVIWTFALYVTVNSYLHH